MNIRQKLNEQKRSMARRADMMMRRRMEGLHSGVASGSSATGTPATTAAGTPQPRKTTLSLFFPHSLYLYLYLSFSLSLISLLLSVVLYCMILDSDCLVSSALLPDGCSECITQLE